MGVAAADSTGDERVFPIDVEHAGIRLALPIIMLIGFVLLFISLSPVVAVFAEGLLGTDAGDGVLTFFVALIGSLGFGVLADRLLKRVWPSGRTLAVSTDGLRLLDRRATKPLEVHILFAQRINRLTWRFTVKRSTPRAPSGWQMLACQLTQDDAQITLYTFMPPKKVASWPDQRLFVSTLAERSMIEAGRLPLREMAEQRRILAAENERWTDGAELTADAFVQVMSLLSAHVSETPHT